MKGKSTQLKATKVFRMVLRGILIGSKMCSFFDFGVGLCIRYKNLILRSYLSCSVALVLVRIG